MRHRRRQLARQRRSVRRQRIVAWAEVLALTAARQEYRRASISLRKRAQVRDGVAMVFVDVLVTGRITEICTQLVVDV